jgi:hypothetical protein
MGHGYGSRRRCMALARAVGKPHIESVFRRTNSQYEGTKKV